MKILKPVFALLLLSVASLPASADVGPARGWQAPQSGQQQRYLDQDMVGHWKSSNTQSRGNMMIRSSSSMVLRPDGGYVSFGGGGYFKRDEGGRVAGGGRGGSERGRWTVREGHLYLMPEGSSKWVHKGAVEKDDDQVAVISPDGSHTVWVRKRPPVSQRLQRPRGFDRPQGFERPRGSIGPRVSSALGVSSARCASGKRVIS